MFKKDLMLDYYEKRPIQQKLNLRGRDDTSEIGFFCLLFIYLFKIPDKLIPTNRKLPT